MSRQFTETLLLGALLFGLAFVSDWYAGVITGNSRIGIAFWIIGLVGWWAIIVVTIRQHRTKRRCENGLCLSCGYDLTGNVSGVCPECGRKVG